MVSRTRILVAKAGLDKHDRGAHIVARALRDAGYEVIYLDAGRLPAEIAQVAIDEDVAAIGLSLLSGAHMQVFRELQEALPEAGEHRILLFAGGTIPPRDQNRLRAMGVVEVFGPGTSIAEVVAAFDRRLAGSRDET
ncbi:MAG: cobalamin B12-binding domain-containing protein [Acidimicrobiia bacterium]